MIGGEVLPAILTEFRERHPGITIELVLSDQTQDLLRRDADIAVRMVRPKQEALVARKIGRIALGLFAHRRYLARHGAPKSLAEVAQHSVIGFDRETAALRALRQTGLSFTREMFALRCDADLAQLAALRAGYGLGVCQLGIARRDPELVSVLPGAFKFELDMWLVMHKDLRTTRRMRLLFDHLVQELTSYIETSRFR
jgi:DNA-binding transcriptional LysR family regulator